MDTSWATGLAPITTDAVLDVVFECALVILWVKELIAARGPRGDDAAVAPAGAASVEATSAEAGAAGEEVLAKAPAPR